MATRRAKLGRRHARRPLPAPVSYRVSAPDGWRVQVPLWMRELGVLPMIERS